MTAHHRGCRSQGSLEKKELMGSKENENVAFVAARAVLREATAYHDRGPCYTEQERQNDRAQTR